uniref:Enoyl-CoA hydratase n=1 Tax=Spongospora subterranea TaxID=70186 RepID=A0A0H5R7D2_9EUKA|eukprot:CRZ10060.1 hypothetical protein [Spongospora subterranea]
MSSKTVVSFEIKSLPGGSGQYGVINLHRLPGNALVPEILEGITSALDVLEANNSVKGFILTSTLPGMFCAGIDLQLFLAETSVFSKFWTSLRTVFLRIYESKLVSIACIQGHAPGGGTILSLACHYRFMLNGKSTIGLNEVAVGLPVPRWLCDVFAQTVGNRVSEKILPYGPTFPAHTAKEIRLVDGIYDTVEGMREAALIQLDKCSKVDQSGRRVTMHFIRRDFAEKMRREEALDMEDLVKAGASPNFQRTVKKVIMSLQAKKNKPKSNL